MKVISPIINVPLEKIGIVFTGGRLGNGKIFEFDLERKTNFYPYQVLDFFFNETKYTIEYWSSIDGVHHKGMCIAVNDDKTTVTDVEAIGNGYVFVTFNNTENSNALLSKADILSELVIDKDEANKVFGDSNKNGQYTDVFENGITKLNIGKPHLVDGETQHKLNSNFTRFEFQSDIDKKLNNTDFISVGKVLFNQNDSDGFTRFYFTINTNGSLHRFLFESIPNKNKYNITAIYSENKQTTIELSFNKVHATFESKTINYFEIFARTPGITQNPYTIFFEVLDLSLLDIPNLNQLNGITANNINWVNNKYENLSFSDGILGYNSEYRLNLNLVGDSYLLAKKIEKNTNIDLLLTPGYYYNHTFEDIHTIVVLPSQEKQIFNLLISDAGSSIYEKNCCYQELTFLTSGHKWRRFFNGQTWSGWLMTANAIHKHEPSDILQNTTNRFVTDDEKILWNKVVGDVGNSTWQQPNNDFNAVKQINGSVFFNSIDNHIYKYSERSWAPIDIDALPINNSISTRTLISGDVYKKIVNGGLSKKITNTDGTKFIYVQSENDVSIYDGLFDESNNMVFDLTNRTELVNFIGSNLINLGFDISSDSSYSVSIGSNIKSTSANTISYGNNIENKGGILLGNNLIGSGIILGNWNNDVSNLFAIGGGSNEETRQNIFEIGTDKILKSFGYSIYEKTAEDLLTADGGTIPKDNFATKIQIENLNTSKSNNKNFAIVEFTGIDDNVKTYKMVISENNDKIEE